jgi:hypothetical protein
MSILLLDWDISSPPRLVEPIDDREAYFWQPRANREVLGVVEHIGVAPTFAGLVNYLRTMNDRQVSATFVIGGDFVGQWALLVGSGSNSPLAEEKLTRAANHAGIQNFPNTNPRPELGNPNWWTVGKEHVGYPGSEWSEPMIQNDLLCNRFLREVLSHRAFTYVLGHYKFDPKDRPLCPGPSFPWKRVYGLDVQPVGPVIPRIPQDELEALPIGDFEGFAKLVKKYSRPGAVKRSKGHGLGGK